MAYAYSDIVPRGDAIREAITVFGTKAIATGCVRLMDELDDGGWLDRGFTGCFVLCDNLYDTPKLRQDLLGVGIPSAVIRRCWKCFKNHKSKAEEPASCLDVTVMSLHR